MSLPEFKTQVEFGLGTRREKDFSGLSSRQWKDNSRQNISALRIFSWHQHIELFSVGMGKK